MVRTSLSGMATLRNSWGISCSIYMNARIAHVHAASIGTMLCIEVPRRRHRKRHATEAFGHAHGPPSSSITGAAFNFSENLAFGDCYISDTRASPSPSSSAVVHSIDTREAALAERERSLQRLENQALTQQEILRDTELVLAGREAELEDRERLLDQTSMVSAGQVLLDQIEEHYTCPLLVYFPPFTQCCDMLTTTLLVIQMLGPHVCAHIH